MVCGAGSLVMNVCMTRLYPIGHLAAPHLPKAEKRCRRNYSQIKPIGKFHTSSTGVSVYCGAGEGLSNRR